MINATPSASAQGPHSNSTLPLNQHHTAPSSLSQFIQTGVTTIIMATCFNMNDTVASAFRFCARRTHYHRRGGRCIRQVSFIDRRRRSGRWSELSNDGGASTLSIH